MAKTRKRRYSLSDHESIPEKIAEVPKALLNSLVIERRKLKK